MAPRLLATLVRDAELPLGSSVWGSTWLDLAAPPGERLRDLFSGLVLQSEARDGRGGLTAGAIFEHFPLGCWSACVIDRQVTPALLQSAEQRPHSAATAVSSIRGRQCLVQRSTGHP